MFDGDSSPPKSLGIVENRLDRAIDLMDAWSRNGEVTSSAFVIGRRRGMTATSLVGPTGQVQGDAGADVDPPFLAASLTKPVIAVAIMILVEQGRLTLDDRVVEFLPEFAEGGKSGVRVRHLLTHTSGLPDQLPENEGLRAGHSPLSRFVAETCRTPLLFPPGTAVRYQSSGFAILGELISRVTGVALPEFLRRELFVPLGMVKTSLGWREGRGDRPMVVQIEADAAATDYHWNSPYWLGLGAPWGGLITSASDYGRFLRMMLGRGTLGGVRLMSRSSARAMVSNQVASFPTISAEERDFRPWGYGWRLHWPGTSSYFGDLLGPRSFGHWGATGTVAWADPGRDTFAVILTSRPPGDRGGYLARLSNILASAFD